MPQQVHGSGAELLARFPPRAAASSWPATLATRQEVLARLLAPPFPLDNPLSQQTRRLGRVGLVSGLPAGRSPRTARPVTDGAFAPAPPGTARTAAENTSA